MAQSTNYFNINVAHFTIIFFSASLLIVGVGIHTVWMSPVIWKLKSNNTDINPLGEPTSTLEIALIAGISPLSGLLATIFLTGLCDIIGRKNTLLVLSIVMFVGTICLAFSTNLYMCYISRFILGVAVGGSVPAVSVFLSEISQDHNRGLIGCFIGLCFPIGNLYVYLTGPLFSVKIFTILCSIPNIINILCLLTFIPESPYYLSSKGDRKGTIKSLERIRNSSPSEIEKEYELILETLKETSGTEEASWKSFFSVKCLRRGFMIASGLIILQQLSGICAILAFAGPLFDASGSALSGDMTAILIGIVKISCVLFTTVIIERVGRRPLLITSSLGACIPHFLLGLFFYLKNIQSPVVEYIMWLPVTSVLGFIVAYSLGIGVIPTSIMSEIFPSNFKSKAANACVFCSMFLIFVVTTFFPIMTEFLGPAWCMWTFSLFCFFGFLFVYFYVPEIKGKSLIEVQEILSK